VKKMIWILALITGCAQQQTAEQAYYAAMVAQAERPLVQIEAMPGQEITGLKSVTVYSPSTQGVQQYRQQQHPGWSILANTLSIAAPIYLMGQAQKDIAQVVGNAVGAVARDVTVVEQRTETVTVVRPEIVNPEIVNPVIVDPVIVPTPSPIIVETPSPIIVEPVIVPVPVP